MIRYTVIPAQPHAHRLKIQCEIDHPIATGHSLRFPTWIPGSYLIREFARHVVSANALQGGRAIDLWKTDKQTWQTAPLASTSTLTVIFEIYAWDLSVRGAHFDQHHLFFNGCAVFPEVVGLDDMPCSVSIQAPMIESGSDWQIFTGLRMASKITAQTSGQMPHQAQMYLGEYIASNYAELIDHPFELGTPTQYTVLHFVVGEIEHRMILRNAGRFNAVRLQSDLQKVCAHLISIFDSPPPFAQYLFLTTLTSNGYGGLEHRNSTALLASREDLPAAGLRDEEPANEEYTRFLGLCAHEYFHAWNVKTLQDASLVQSDLRQEAYTPLLWFFEGFTSYYDDLSLVRCGVISSATYIKLLEKTLKQVNTPAQEQQSVAESSFDAWIKYYRADENAPNSIVSYYAKGSLVALALDLTLRREKNHSLDGWLRALWQDFALQNKPLTEEQLFDHLAQFAGEPIAQELRQWVTAREPLNLAPLLNNVGLTLTDAPSTGMAAWGLRVNAENTLAKVSHVLNNSAAEAAGLAPGDLLVAINEQRITHANLEKCLDRLDTNSTARLLFFREDKLCSLDLKPSEIRPSEPSLAPVSAIDMDQMRHQLAWLSI